MRKLPLLKLLTDAIVMKIRMTWTSDHNTIQDSHPQSRKAAARLTCRVNAFGPRGRDGSTATSRACLAVQGWRESRPRTKLCAAGVRPGLQFLCSWSSRAEQVV